MMLEFGRAQFSQVSVRYVTNADVRRKWKYAELLILVKKRKLGPLAKQRRFYRVQRKENRRKSRHN